MAKKSRRKPQAKAAAAPQREAVKPSDVIKVPSEVILKKLVRALKGHEADKNEAVGNMGSLIAQAVEKHHLDKRAFRMANTLGRLEDHKLAITYFHLLHYLEVLGVPERAKAQEEMFARPGEADESEGESEEEDEGEAELVIPASREAEEAGEAVH